jgi:two-component system nitrogen regulation response regulator GlnG/two-component system response regulator HydG
MTQSTIPEQDLPWGKRPRMVRDVPALAIAWALEEPERVGEVALVTGAMVLGRGPAQPEDSGPRATFVRQRPGESGGGSPLASSRISRVQLRVAPTDGGGVEVTQVGKLAMFFRGAEVKKATLAPGDVLVLKNALVLMVVSRPTSFEPLRGKTPEKFSFGRADAYGVVGESVAAWRLRDAVAFAAGSPHHVLVQGPSGSGKELAARAIHGLSPRAGKDLIARNAATFPEGLVDAELFGTAKNYPNAGSAERAGVIGEADGTTLFLDEIGELPPPLQAHLLRVLDKDGEYQRLGESRVRKSDVRLVAATNRTLDALKHDFAARMAVRVAIPGLEERREDIPLLVRHVLDRLAREMPDVAARFFEDVNGAKVARIEPALVEGLLLHRYTHHLRELDRLVWTAVSSSREGFLARTPEVETELRIEAPRAAGDADIDEATIRSALEAASDNVTRAAKALGLKNRFALYRVMKKYGITVGAEGAEGAEDEA